MPKDADAIAPNGIAAITIWKGASGDNSWRVVSNAVAIPKKFR